MDPYQKSNPHGRSKINVTKDSSWHYNVGNGISDKPLKGALKENQQWSPHHQPCGLNKPLGFGLWPFGLWRQSKSIPCSLPQTTLSLGYINKVTKERNPTKAIYLSQTDGRNPHKLGLLMSRNPPHSPTAHLHFSLLLFWRRGRRKKRKLFLPPIFKLKRKETHLSLLICRPFLLQSWLF